MDPIRYAAGDVNLYRALGNGLPDRLDPLGLSWLDWVQGGLDVIGVFDPTPISDGVNALISVGRGDWTGAGLSAISMIPYAGDVIGKGGKAVRYGKKTVDAIEAAKPVAKPTVAPATSRAAEQAAIRQRVLANIAKSQVARNASNFHVHAAYEQLGQLRRGLGLPNTGVRETDGVLTLLEVNGRRFYGINSWAASDDAARAAFTNAGFRNPVTGNVPHRAVANHAEGDTFLQAFLAGQRGGHGRLYIDSTMCGFCGRSGGVRGMARGLGLDSLEVFERLPNGGIRRVPNLLE